jgi:hypothetical protein
MLTGDLIRRADTVNGESGFIPPVACSEYYVGYYFFSLYKSVACRKIQC